MSPGDVKQTPSLSYSKDEWCHMSIFSPFLPSLAGESGFLGARKNEKCTSREKEAAEEEGEEVGLFFLLPLGVWGKAGSDGIRRNKKRAPPPPPLSPPGEIR